jgi:hypothetical protein
MDSGSTALWRVAVISANDVWASGNTVGTDGKSKVLSEHWDGNQWNVVAAPSIGVLGSRTEGIAAVSRDDIWMVGDYDETGSLTNNPPKTLTEHWDGTKWSVVPSPNPPLGITGSWLRSATALSANDVWAVGYYRVGSPLVPLIEHWDGTQWSIVPNPVSANSVVNGVLNDIKALAPNNIWIVGHIPLGVGGQGVSGNPPLVFHWDGTQWSSISVPSPGPGLNILSALAPISPNDIWAVGSSDSGPITMHWDGNQWSLVPNPLLVGQGLFGGTAIATNDVWAVGQDFGGTSLAVHWDGVEWSIIPTPEPAGTRQSYLYGIGAASATDIWTVSHAIPNAGGGATLVEHFTSPCAGSAVVPTSVVSRKMHGDAGTFDVDLPFTGNSGIECRSGGANGDYTLVFTFANPLANVGGASLTDGVGSSSSGAIGSDPHQYIVNVTGVTNAQTITVRLTNVTDSLGNVSGAISRSMSVLVGDTTADGLVNSADIAQTKSQSGNIVGASNFREDVTADGNFNSADIALAKSKSGTGLQ